jgi:hypothetical protein
VTFQGALIREQGVTFAIVIVKAHIVKSPMAAQDAVRAFRPAFPGVPVVLMGQDGRGVPTYYGRRDIVNFLANVPMECIPWQEFTLVA